MIQDALLRYDSQQGIQRLLIIYLCLIENIRTPRLATPIYLYRWTEGRTMLLERMLEGDVLLHCKELSLDMYNFYTRQDMPQAWSFDGEPEFQLDRVRLESREESLVQDAPPGGVEAAHCLYGSDAGDVEQNLRLSCR